MKQSSRVDGQKPHPHPCLSPTCRSQTFLSHPDTQPHSSPDARQLELLLGPGSCHATQHSNRIADTPEGPPLLVWPVRASCSCAWYLLSMCCGHLSLKLAFLLGLALPQQPCQSTSLPLLGKWIFRLFLNQGPHSLGCWFPVPAASPPGTSSCLFAAPA